MDTIELILRPQKQRAREGISEVKDAHDYYANIEVAYLLQKIEEYDGFVILAANLILNIDDASKR
jgi:hypothetical protein